MLYYYLFNYPFLLNLLQSALCTATFDFVHSRTGNSSDLWNSSDLFLTNESGTNLRYFLLLESWQNFPESSVGSIDLVWPLSLSGISCKSSFLENLQGRNPWSLQILGRRIRLRFFQIHQIHTSIKGMSHLHIIFTWSFACWCPRHEEMWICLRICRRLRIWTLYFLMRIGTCH